MRMMLLALGMSFCAVAHAQSEIVTIFAAASLSAVLDEAIKTYQQQNPQVVIHTSYAASGTLARQIIAGAPADIFISADQTWADHVAQQHQQATTLKPLLANRLVLIAPKNAQVPAVQWHKPQWAQQITGRVCMGNPQSVPAGRYAEQALKQLGWWSSWQTQLVPTEDVTAALTFVARGECALGVVYQTDALQSTAVKSLGRFAIGSHQPIIYPMAQLGQTPTTHALYQWLQGSQAKRIFQRFGFAHLPAAPTASASKLVSKTSP